MHVHSTFSDGADRIEDNIAEAEALGLTALGCVDHVRASTDWVPSYVAAVNALRSQTRVELRCGIEAKLLDTTGALDLPADIDGVDAIYAADHQVPLESGPAHPREVKERIASGDLQAGDVIDAILTSTARALERPQRVVIAHFLSILPKLGLTEADVPASGLDMLAEATARTGQEIEISERWRCPSAATLRRFAARGVPIVLSTDSHKRGTIGRYEHCLTVLRELAAPAGGTTHSGGPGPRG
jgi:putative hydrolase